MATYILGSSYFGGYWPQGSSPGLSEAEIRQRCSEGLSAHMQASLGLGAVDADGLKAMRVAQGLQMQGQKTEYGSSLQNARMEDGNEKDTDAV